jgi:hypothetical protein
MSLNLFCVFMGHKWTPGEATNEPSVRMVCQRCGRPQRGVVFADRPNESPADKRKDVSGGGMRL